MKSLNLIYFDLIQKAQSVKSVYEIVSLNLVVIVLTILSYETANTTLSVWSSLFAGFTFGLVLVKLPAGIKFLKRGHKNDSNQS